MVSALAAAVLASLAAQDRAVPPEPWVVEDLPAPEGVVLEVGGLALLDDGRPLVATRRGQVFVVDGAYGGGEASFHLFVDGLQEPLGLLVHDGWIWTAQRGELTRMRDVDGDDRADELETVADPWRISGNYHEYNFGPRLAPDGKLWITTNKPFGDEPFGRVDWRGWALRFDPGGGWEPMSCGLRSPAGLEVSPWGDVFYTDNQGEWCGASKLSRLVPGSFHGHPWGLDSCRRPEWRHGHPGEIPSGRTMPEVARALPSFELPAVWFPYDAMGRSPSGFVWDRTGGAFGPFAGQVLVGDQYAASLMRVFLEEVGGHWQGACFPFLSGLRSGVVRVAWDAEGALLIGTSDRGWASLGPAGAGLQRVRWTGRVPFEIRAMRARADGFELELTLPVDAERAADPASYTLESYTYLLHADYGSPEVERAAPRVVAAELVAEDRVRLRVDGLRAGYVHELEAAGLRSRAGLPLRHASAFYTLARLADER